MANESLSDFELRATAFLSDATSPRTPERPFAWGVGSDWVGLLGTPEGADDESELDTAMAWKRREFDAGFGWLTGAVEFGGAGLSATHERRYSELRAAYATPSLATLTVSIGMIAPTIEAHGTDALKKLYLRDLHRGSKLACQLFSEPDAGSDLASLRTRAIRDDGGWRLTGQKVWTSLAHRSDIGEVLVRTDPDTAKHRGITAMVIDMNAAGVDVRPLRQMSGAAHFNEVFLTDVWVPDDHVLGKVDGGWEVALTSLASERSSVGGRQGHAGSGGVNRVLQLAKWLGRESDPSIQKAISDLYVHMRVAALTNSRIKAEARFSRDAGSLAAMSKISRTRNWKRIADIVSTLLGPRLTADTGEWGTYAWNKLILDLPGVKLGGGTEEVLRNVLSERVLGLPKERSGVDA